MPPVHAVPGSSYRGHRSERLGIGVTSSLSTSVPTFGVALPTITSPVDVCTLAPTNRLIGPAIFKPAAERSICRVIAQRGLPSTGRSQRAAFNQLGVPSFPPPQTG